MSSRRHRKGRIGADSLYKQEFLSYIVFSCLPVGTGRVVSVLIVYINKNFCLTLYFHVFPSRRHRKGRIGADSLYKQEFLSYIVFSCLPVGTGRVVSVLK